MGTRNFTKIQHLKGGESMNISMYKKLNCKNENIISLQKEVIELITANCSLVRQKDHLMGLLEQGIESMGEVLEDQ